MKVILVVFALLGTVPMAAPVTSPDPGANAQPMAPLNLAALRSMALAADFDGRLLAAQSKATGLDTLEARTFGSREFDAEWLKRTTPDLTSKYSIQLSQSIRFKVADRARHKASADGRAAESRRELRQREVSWGLLDAWLDWQWARSKSLQSDSIRGMWREMAQQLQKGLQQGRASELDWNQAEIEKAAADQDFADAEAEWANAHARLEHWVGRPLRREEVLPGDIGAWLSQRERSRAGDLGDTATFHPISKDSALAAVANHPEISAWRLAITAGEKEVDWQMALASPEMALHVGYEKEGDGGHFVGAGITVPLPQRNRNATGIARAKAELQSLRLQAEKVAGELALHWHLAETARRSAKARWLALDQKQRPLRLKQAALAEEAYRQGRLDATEVLRLRQAAALGEAEWLAALGAYAKATAYTDFIQGRNSADENLSATMEQP